MSVFKEINKADGSGVTQFFRLSSEKQTVETHDYGDFYNFKGSVASESDLPTTKLEVGDAYFIEDEEKTVVKNVRVKIMVGSDTVYDEKESPTSTNIKATKTDKGSKEVTVYIDDIWKATKTFNFNTQSSITIE